MIGECELPAGTHSYIFTIKPSDKTTTGMSSEFRVIPYVPNVYNAQVKSILLISLLLPVTKSLSIIVHKCTNNKVKYTALIILRYMFPLGDQGTVRGPELWAPG